MLFVNSKNQNLVFICQKILLITFIMTNFSIIRDFKSRLLEKYPYIHPLKTDEYFFKKKNYYKRSSVFCV